MDETTGLSALDTARLAKEKAVGFVTALIRLLITCFFTETREWEKPFSLTALPRDLIDSSHSVIYFSAYDLFDYWRKIHSPVQRTLRN